jgi:uncharacterized membrane protein YfcA
MLTWRHRRRLTKVEHLLAAATWLLSGAAGAIAVEFAWRVKPHVLWQTLAAYGLVWALLAYYGYAQRLQRRLLCLHLWLVAVCFAAVLVFVHLDDMPARLVYRDDGPEGPRMWLRPGAPRLYWPVVFDCAWAAVFTVRALWLNWRILARDEATEGEQG